MARKPKKPLEVETLTHDATRKNIPTAEFESIMREQDKTPIQLAYERRNKDLDPQLVWRGKEEQDWSDLIVQAPPLYIQEKVHPKAIIDDLKRETRTRAEAKAQAEAPQFDMFSDFNGLPDPEAATEFYQHDQHWSNRMISGDSLSVMASLAEREGLRGQVQCIYFDPPYGIKFNSNFQWSTTSRDVKDGAKDHITREPEQVRAFRDTWKDGIHSYLTYLRDRMTVARDLLHESGSIFVQIGDENVHRVRTVMDEVFGDENFVSEILVKKTGGVGAAYLDNVFDILIWYSRNRSVTKYRPLYEPKSVGEGEGTGKRYDQIETSPFMVRGLNKDEKESIPQLLELEEKGGRFFQLTSLNSDSSSAATTFDRAFEGDKFFRTNWKSNGLGLERLIRANRVRKGDTTIRFRRYLLDFPATSIANFWDDTKVSGKVYVVQTADKIVARCIQMTTDPGDLVLDPTCGSGTTAYAAEHWGRRWITIDTSRVAIALARSRLMGARYPYYLLADSPDGQTKEGEISRTPPKSNPTYGRIRQGFVYERVPHIMLRDVTTDTEIDVIWEKMQPPVEDAISALNVALAGHTEPFLIQTGARSGHALDFVSGANQFCSIYESRAVPVYQFLSDELPEAPGIDWPEEAKIELAKAKAGSADALSRLNAMLRGESITFTLTKGSRVGKDLQFDAEEAKLHHFVVDVDVPMNVLLEWEIPREPGTPWPVDQQALHAKARAMATSKTIQAEKALTELNELRGSHFTLDTLPEYPITPWPNEAEEALDRFWNTRIARQQEIDASVSAKADSEYLYDRPYPDSSKTRVAGPFTVESLSPHRTLAVDWDDELIDLHEAAEGKRQAEREGTDDFAHMILENLKAAGVQQAKKEDRITFTALTGWPGRYICAEGTFMEGEVQRRAGIFIGPEFGTVSRPDLVAAAREAGDADFDMLITCAFNYDAHSAEFDKLGRVPVLKARMNPDLHMGGDLKATGAGNLFVVFGEPDIKIEDADDGMIRVKVFGVDVFKPQTGEVLSEGTDGIALWMLDTDYNEESFFVRHAYFLGANDPYKALKTTLKAEIDEDAWDSLYSDTSRPFPKPKSGRIAVKVINHLGDEVMKIFAVG